MQQQAAAAAAMFGGRESGVPNFGSGQPEQMYVPPGMDPAAAMRSMQYVQAMAANAAMMGFQVAIRTAFLRDSETSTCWLYVTQLML